MNADHVGCPAFVLDASALIHAILRKNSDAFSFLLQRQCYCSVINWLEIEFLIKNISEEEGTEFPWTDFKELFISDYHLKVEAFTFEDAEWVADRISSHGSSLPDSGLRLSCLALGSRLGLTVATADPMLKEDRWVRDEVRVILL